MSRLIVKNVPPYLTQGRFRAHFESSDGPGGTLTDAKLVLQPNGTSRRFGFIGYRTPAEAQRAQKWFNRTFMDSSRIAVEIVEVRWHCSFACITLSSNAGMIAGCEECSGT